MNRIALVEDHERLSELLVKALLNAGIETDVFDRMEAASLAASHNAYAVLVVDRGLPDGDGLDLVRQLRAADIRTPCLILTARDALRDRVEGLESGADDYLTKPFSMDEFVARARALMRRPPVLQSLTPEFGDIHVRPAEGCMTCGLETVTLAPAELQIMIVLIRVGGTTVRRSALEVAAWGLGEAVTPNALDVAMHRLKRKLLAINSTLQIVNARGYGYALRFIPLAT
ncbi:MAG: two-component system, OmpR family, response regulator QseB [Gammaproteobacteria bacterium]|jgi:DNA-binding response OmpR family regulator|nr:two-component system, OmpR family, response regulator QseB [Gammaproteobacteria bacterium]HWM70337.1 response regulator transcription factor [Steroidobacteraceae bacterium]